jgi:enoyl-CoA hydratase/carnithine racemase
VGYESIVTERRDGVAVIILNRPDKLNALSFGLIRELDHELALLGADDAVGAVVLTGAGDKAFSAGADIHEMAGLSARRSATAQTGRSQRSPSRSSAPSTASRTAERRCSRRCSTSASAASAPSSGSWPPPTDA